MDEMLNDAAKLGIFIGSFVAGVLGYFAYGFSKGQTEAFTAQLAAQPDLDPETASDLEQFAMQEDQKVRNAIITGVLLLTFALGVYLVRAGLPDEARGQFERTKLVQNAGEYNDLIERLGK